MKRLIKSPPTGLRQRQRANGSWRLWWEPNGTQRKLEFEAVELDANRLTWSIKEAERINKLVANVAAGNPKVAAGTTGGGPRKGSFDQLVDRYFKSPEFDQLSAASKDSYSATIRRLRQKWATARVSDFDRAICKEYYDTLYGTGKHTQALHLIRMLSVLLSYAVEIGWIEHNPALNLRKVTPPPRQRLATWDEIDALLDAAAALDWPTMGLAVALSVFNGQRQADIINAKVAAFQAGCWELVRSKNKRASRLVLHHETAKWLPAAIAAGREDRERLILDPVTGLPTDKYGFSKRFDQIRAEAAKACPSLLAPDRLQFRDLRRTFSALARDAGVEDRDRADALGNTSDVNAALSQTYNPPSDRAAAKAIHSITRPERKTA